MKVVREILDALSSPGGNLVILCVAVLISGTAAVAVGVGNKSTEVDNFLLSVFSGFSGALLQALTSRPWRPGEASGGRAPEIFVEKH